MVTIRQRARRSMHRIRGWVRTAAIWADRVSFNNFIGGILRLGGLGSCGWPTRWPSETGAEKRVTTQATALSLKAISVATVTILRGKKFWHRSVQNSSPYDA